MSQDMVTVVSDDDSVEHSLKSEEEMEDEEDIFNYYNCDVEEHGDTDNKKCDDPEFFDYELLKVEDVERLLNESVEALSQAIKVSPALAKVLLHTQKWLIPEIISRHKKNTQQLLIDSKILPRYQEVTSVPCMICLVCLQRSDHLLELTCGHSYCRECWQTYFHMQIQAGLSTAIECMGKDCCVLADEDFVLNLLTSSSLRDKYQEYTFRDHVKGHPEMRFCPGPNCNVVVRAVEPAAKRVVCSQCNTAFCFKCGIDYHAPTDCETIKKWLTKCADDSETANYISAHTKDVSIVIVL